MNQDIVCNEIDNAIKCLTNLKNLIKTDVKIEVQSVAPAQIVESDFESLKAALYSDKWPNAVNPNLICDPNSETDKKERSIGILELVIEDTIKGGKFLDFGCGEGHCAATAVETLGCSLSVGYDTKRFNWPTVSNTTFTTSYQEVAALGPYDAILIFDVIDHVANETPEDILTKATNLLAPNGKIYLRTHPWISRHGTHLYHKLNKAFAHLVFTDDELKQLSDHVPENNIKVTYPMRTYNAFFAAANLKAVSERVIKENLEPFFRIPKIADRILNNTKNVGHVGFPDFQMAIQFIDYVLVKQ